MDKIYENGSSKTDFDHLSDVIVISSGKPGPRVGIMAVTHGDEPAGLSAHAFLMDVFQTHSLDHGTLFLIQGNPEAAKQGMICIDENLNRIFQDDHLLTEKQKNSREYTRSRELMPLLASLDYLLDIHSTSSPSMVFSIIKTDTPAHREIAAYLPVEFFSSGWTGYIDGTTCDYADSQGCISTTIECGTHTNPQGGEIAIRAAMMFLQKLKIQDFDTVGEIVTKHLLVTGRESIGDKDTFTYSRSYDNFDHLLPRELIATDSLTEYSAPDHTGSVIIFPTKIDHIRNGHCKEAYLLGRFL